MSTRKTTSDTGKGGSKVMVSLSSSACSDVNAGVRTGTPVKVRGGPFCGHIGFLEERRPHRLALVWIEVLGHPVRVEIEPYYLDVLN